MQGFFRVMVWILVIFGAVCGLLYLTIFDVWTVPADDPKLSASLDPNTNAGDVLLVMRHQDVTDGQLARCVDPAEPLRFVLGRIEAMDGEEIDITDQRIKVDNKAVPVPSGCGEVTLVTPGTNIEQNFRCGIEDNGGREHNILSAEDTPEGNTAHAKVDRGKAFLVSDNRHWHLDSRDYGTVPSGNCQHVVFRLWGAKGWLDSKHRNTLLW